MEVIEGYKKTDVGIIPNDWDVRELGEVVVFTNGKAHEQYIDDNGNYIVVNSKFISSEGEVAKYSKENLSPLFTGDITMVMSDIPNGKALAKCFLVKQNGKYTLNQRICSFKPYNANNEYLFYILNRNKYFLAFDSGVGQTNLKKSEILNCPIPLPTKAEQSAIAAALSDADALIISLEKLITKKRNIEQGAMQELLTGKKRLPGFSGEWEVKEIEDIFYFKQGVQCPIEKQKLQEENGLKRFIRIIDLTQPDELPRYIDDPGTSHHIFPDDLFMVRYGSPGLLGYGCEGVIANNLFRLIPKIKIDSKFYYHLLTYKNNDILQLSSSTTMAALNFESLRLLKIVYPPRVEEQTAIATILSDMDSEIEQLEQKLDKYRMIKQGMMQELLTGKTRLI